MKKNILKVILIIMLLIFTYILINNIYNSSMYICKEYDSIYNINSNIYNLSEIKHELEEISQKYEEGLKLTFVQYNIHKNKNEANFQFYKNNKNIACLLNINVNIDTKKTTNIKYEKGSVKRVKGYFNEINSLEKITDYINPNEDINIIVTSEGLSLYKNGQKLEKNDFIKNVTNIIEEEPYTYNGVITEINDNNIVFKNQSNNKKYSIDINNNFNFINGRTNDKIDLNSLNIGYYLDARLLFKVKINFYIK